MLHQTHTLLSGMKTATRVVALGDVHGRLDQLKAAIAAIENPYEAELVLLGDYVHRGPDSRGVLDYLRALEADHPFAGLIILPGNHDHMLIDAAARPWGDGMIDWEYNQNYLAIDKEYFGWDRQAAIDDLAGSYPQQIYDRLSGKLPTWHKNGDLLFVHGGIHPRGGRQQNYPTEVRYPVLSMWVRNPFLYDRGPHRGPEGEDVIVVHGHTNLPGATPGLIMEIAERGLEYHRISIDISHTDAMIMMDAQGDQVTLSYIRPQPKPQNEIRPT